MASLKVLGIDPGLEYTGLGLIEVSEQGGRVLGWWTIQTDAKDPLPVRLRTIQTGIHRTIKELELTPQNCKFSVELYIAAKRKGGGFDNNAMFMQYVIGVILLSLYGFVYEMVSPMTTKVRIGGHGKADKKEIRQRIVDMFGLEGEKLNTHELDALAHAATIMIQPTQRRRKRATD